MIAPVVALTRETDLSPPTIHSPSGPTGGPSETGSGPAGTMELGSTMAVPSDVPCPTTCRMDHGPVGWSFVLTPAGERTRSELPRVNSSLPEGTLGPGVIRPVARSRRVRRPQGEVGVS